MGLTRLNIPKGFPQWEVLTTQSDGKVVIDASDEVVDWIWAQPKKHWEHVAEPTNFPYGARLLISAELQTILSLRFRSK